MLLYILHLHVLVSVSLCLHKDRQQQVVKQAIRVHVYRAAVSRAAVKDYTVILKHLLVVCISHAYSDASTAAAAI